MATADEIRKWFVYDAGDPVPPEAHLSVIAELLREIAAQLAEVNEMKREEL